jgi:Protein of unknown function (DUF1569)
MEQRSFFDRETYDALLSRIGRLTPDTEPRWGKMNVAQMCAHCAEVAAVAGGKSLEGTPWYIRLFGGLIKRLVVSPRPYPHGVRTHPQYRIPATVDFEAERDRLETVLGALFAAGPEPARHPLFGPLTAEEVGWSTYKHLDHHLTQFGV